MNARILIVDADQQIVRVLRINFRRHGYQTGTAANGRSALAPAARRPPALVVLDLYPPDMQGVEVIRSLRRWSRAPIIVLSGCARTGDTVAALDAGADDYLTKPFNMDELLARVRAVSRRAYRTHDIAQVRIGEHTVDLAQRLVTGPQDGVTLTPSNGKSSRSLSGTPAGWSAGRSCSPRWVAPPTSRRTGACGCTWPTCAASSN